jgi:type IV secretory pathway TraG/TraD family ATPase VirD4
MPFWTPSDEVQYPAEAAAIADSLFPDRPRDNNFFTEAARKIFTHLLRYRPTPQELMQWMENMDEVDRRVAETELEAMIQKGARAQRAAVQATFNQAAAAFQLLPSEPEGQGRWSASHWAKERKGWIFIPTLPVLRESLRPLLSMWLACLILRLMDANARTVSRVWFILDELSSLQRLPQLPAAITESRKSALSRNL